jgi:putative effector of murein hydrolase LrgA (UPF0299 family)
MADGRASLGSQSGIPPGILMPEGVRIVVVLAVAALVVLVIYGVIAGLMLGFRTRKDRTR